MKKIIDSRKKELIDEVIDEEATRNWSDLSLNSLSVWSRFFSRTKVLYLPTCLNNPDWHLWFVKPGITRGQKWWFSLCESESFTKDTNFDFFFLGKGSYFVTLVLKLKATRVCRANNSQHWQTDLEDDSEVSRNIWRQVILTLQPPQLSAAASFFGSQWKTYFDLHHFGCEVKDAFISLWHEWSVSVQDLRTGYRCSCHVPDGPIIFTHVFTRGVNAAPKQENR